MQDITSKEEQQARRQFSRLFCGEVMHICTKDAAVNEDSWNEVILDDIIHRAYPGNRLTTEKIKVLIAMLGWPNEALYFSKPQDRATIEWVFPFIAEYISMRSYIQFKQSEVPDPTQSVIQFYKKFCTHNSNAAIRITTSDIYELYLTWCYNTERSATTSKTFHTAFVKLGAVRNKGYCEGKSGVTFYLLKLNPEEVLNDVQQEDTPKETRQEKSYSPESLRDDNRPGITICKESVEGEASSILPNEERQDTQPIDSRDGIGNEPDDQADAVVIARNEVAFRQQIPSTPENRDTIDHITQNFGDQFPALRNFAPAELSKTGATATNNIQHTGSKPIQYPNDPTNIIGRLKQLPIGFRPTFDEIRICCKIAMDPFTKEQFTAMANDAGFHFTEEQCQELYDFLIEYAKADLRELKKGAIQ
jgi:hypothetical protein